MAHNEEAAVSKLTVRPRHTTFELWMGSIEGSHNELGPGSR